MEVRWRVVADHQGEVTEHPVWDERTHSLFWVDCLAGLVLRWTDANGHEVWWRSSGTVGCVALRKQGGLVVAADNRIHLLDSHGVETRPPYLVDVPEGSRFNDGAVDPAGRLVVGTTGGRLGHNAQLFSITSTGDYRLLRSGLTESNGLGWSPDGDTLFHVDSGGAGLTRADYRPETGELGEKIPMPLHVAHGEVLDGLAVAKDGTVWVAVWQGGRVLQVSPEGDLLATLVVSVPNPTCLSFGGPGNKTAFLASARYGVDPPPLGGVLATELSVAGLEQYRFTG